MSRVRGWLRRRAWWLALGVIVLAGLVLRPFQVSGSSMEPQFRAGDWVLTIPLLGPPQRGQVVVFAAPDGSGRSMKRVAGLPGESPHRVHQRLQPDPARPAIDTSHADWGSAAAGQAGIPEDHYFLLGDKLEDSVDSRRFGPVRAAAVERRVLGRLWPLARD